MVAKWVNSDGALGKILLGKILHGWKQASGAAAIWPWWRMRPKDSVTKLGLGSQGNKGMYILNNIGD